MSFLRAIIYTRGGFRSLIAFVFFIEELVVAAEYNTDVG